MSNGTSIAGDNVTPDAFRVRRVYIRDVNLQALRSAARYAWRADTIYDIHAPLAYAFLGEVIEDRRHFYVHDDIEALRRRYASDDTLIELDDAGAGSQVRTARRSRVRDIASGSATPARLGRYLTSLVDWRGARRVLELGSNLGIGSCYLAAGMPFGGRLVTIDADPGMAAYAKTGLAQTVPLARADVVTGTFAERLPAALETLGRVDVAFVDGHHAEGPTKAYFEHIRAYCHADTVLVFDDIHWSSGMEAAWAWIREQPGVSLTLDLYRWGVVFFDPSVKSPQHLDVAPWRWKPWHMGFFKSRT